MIQINLARFARTIDFVTRFAQKKRKNTKQKKYCSLRSQKSKLVQNVKTRKTREIDAVHIEDVDVVLH